MKRKNFCAAAMGLALGLGALAGCAGSKEEGILLSGAGTEGVMESGATDAAGVADTGGADGATDSSGTGSAGAAEASGSADGVTGTGSGIAADQGSASGVTETAGTAGSAEASGATDAAGVTESAGAGGAGTDAGGASAQGTIYVQVCGEVRKPGVYELSQGSRVFQAVDLAGGVTESAAVEELNQAEPLSDGQMVYIMSKREARQKRRQEAQGVAAAGQEAQDMGTAGQDGSGAEAPDDGKVNLNTATAEELQQLPGIGEAKAGSILAWREENGRFAQIEDLMKVEGIKEGVFSKIKDSVKVE